MKGFILFLCIPCSLFCGEVNENEFHYLIDREIKDINEAILLLSPMDATDAYTYYWLIGMKYGLECAKCTFNDCCESHSGCK